MSDNISSKVPLNLSNVGMCLCPHCPVQSNSQCVSIKLADLSTALAKNNLNRIDIPGEYCSTGPATCTDLDQKQPCMCPRCRVFTAYGLAQSTPLGWYCGYGFVK